MSEFTRVFHSVKLKKPRKEKCDQCHGRGKLDKDYQVFDCPWCGGRGQVNVTTKTVMKKPVGKTMWAVTLYYEEGRYPGDKVTSRVSDRVGTLKDVLWRAGHRPKKVSVKISTV